MQGKGRRRGGRRLFYGRSPATPSSTFFSFSHCPEQERRSDPGRGIFFFEKAASHPPLQRSPSSPPSHLFSVRTVSAKEFSLLLSHHTASSPLSLPLLSCCLLLPPFTLSFDRQAQRSLVARLLRTPDRTVVAKAGVRACRNLSFFSTSLP